MMNVNGSNRKIEKVNFWLIPRESCGGSMGENKITIKFEFEISVASGRWYF